MCGTDSSEIRSESTFFTRLARECQIEKRTSVLGARSPRTPPHELPNNAPARATASVTGPLFARQNASRKGAQGMNVEKVAVTIEYPPAGAAHLEASSRVKLS
jgi:hypothetical protein